MAIDGRRERLRSPRPEAGVHNTGVQKEHLWGLEFSLVKLVSRSNELGRDPQSLMDGQIVGLPWLRTLSGLASQDVGLWTLIGMEQMH